MKDFNEQLNEEIAKLYQRKDLGPTPGNHRWQWVAETINEKYDLSLTSNAVRKREGYHNRGQGERRVTVRRSEAGKPRKNVKFNSENVLVIGDTHIPFDAPGYLEWCKAMYDRYKCDTVVHIGDVADQHAVSFWDSDPDGMSAGSELEATRRRMKEWATVFPSMKICIGNHDARPMRKMVKAGMSRAYLKAYNDIFGTPETWEWNWSYVSNGVLYEHGTRTGKHATTNRMIAVGRNVVIGHTHIFPGVVWNSTEDKIWFGMNVGCGLDVTSYAMAYGSGMAYEPTLGCGVVLNEGALPVFLPFND